MVKPVDLVPSPSARFGLQLFPPCTTPACNARGGINAVPHTSRGAGSGRQEPRFCHFVLFLHPGPYHIRKGVALSRSHIIKAAQSKGEVPFSVMTLVLLDLRAVLAWMGDEKSHLLPVMSTWVSPAFAAPAGLDCLHLDDVQATTGWRSICFPNHCHRRQVYKDK